MAGDLRMKLTGHKFYLKQGRRNLFFPSPPINCKSKKDARNAFAFLLSCNASIHFDHTNKN